MIVPYLRSLTKAPLEPLQCLFGLKTTAFLKLIYHIAVEQKAASELTRVARMVRAIIMQWIALPNDLCLRREEDTDGVSFNES